MRAPHYGFADYAEVVKTPATVYRTSSGAVVELGEEFTNDLPEERPFRITYFFGRSSVAYHVGFSDIARGGWRSIPCPTPDDLTTNTNTLFREVYVLAHTQHLKNKDIYEGGSKMGAVLDATDLTDPALVTQRLYKLQFGFLHAFLDLFVTVDGRQPEESVGMSLPELTDLMLELGSVSAFLYRM